MIKFNKITNSDIFESDAEDKDVEIELNPYNLGYNFPNFNSGSIAKFLEGFCLGMDDWQDTAQDLDHIIESSSKDDRKFIGNYLKQLATTYLNFKE